MRDPNEKCDERNCIDCLLFSRPFPVDYILKTIDFENEYLLSLNCMYGIYCLAMKMNLKTILTVKFQDSYTESIHVTVHGCSIDDNFYF